jgi:hypothetical protein
VKTEAELRELHRRLTRAIGYAKGVGVSHRDLYDLHHLKVTLEWILEDGTKVAEAWNAAIMKGLINIEGLERSHERSRKAAEN